MFTARSITLAADNRCPTADQVNAEAAERLYVENFKDYDCIIGPIGIILDPTFDEFKYSELPYHSTLCGSCSDVCPVKIDIGDQILKWRRVMAAKGYLPLAKRLSFAVAGHVFGHPEEYHVVEKAAGPMLDHTPHFLLYNRSLNPWGRDRELPAVAKQTFRDWYVANRTPDNADQ